MVGLALPQKVCPVPSVVVPFAQGVQPVDLVVFVKEPVLQEKHGANPVLEYVPARHTATTLGHLQARKTHSNSWQTMWLQWKQCFDLQDRMSRIGSEERSDSSRLHTMYKGLTQLSRMSQQGTALHRQQEIYLDRQEQRADELEPVANVVFPTEQETHEVE